MMRAIRELNEQITEREHATNNSCSQWLRHSTIHDQQEMRQDLLLTLDTRQPTTSPGIERAFSGVILLLSDARQRLTDEHIETYELLRYWCYFENVKD